MFVKADQDPKLDIFGISGEIPQSGLTKAENRVKNDTKASVNDKGCPIGLGRRLINACYSTFFARVNGNSMEDATVENSDLLVIDKSLRPYHNCLAVCFLNGEFILKRVRFQENQTLLISADNEDVSAGNADGGHYTVWGVVKYVIKRKQEGDAQFFV